MELLHAIPSLVSHKVSPRWQPMWWTSAEAPTVTAHSSWHSMKLFHNPVMLDYKWQHQVLTTTHEVCHGLCCDQKSTKALDNLSYCLQWIRSNVFYDLDGYCPCLAFSSRAECLPWTQVNSHQLGHFPLEDPGSHLPPPPGAPHAEGSSPYGATLLWTPLGQSRQHKRNLPNEVCAPESTHSISFVMTIIHNFDSYHAPSVYNQSMVGHYRHNSAPTFMYLPQGQWGDRECLLEVVNSQGCECGITYDCDGWDTSHSHFADLISMGKTCFLCFRPCCQNVCPMTGPPLRSLFFKDCVFCAMLRWVQCMWEERLLCLAKLNYSINISCGMHSWKGNSAGNFSVMLW